MNDPTNSNTPPALPVDDPARIKPPITEEDGEVSHVPGIAGYFGGRSLQLPGGRRISLADTIWGDLRSAFVVRPWGDERDWEAFSYSYGQIVAGAPGVAATALHTNVPRSGLIGLPKDWEMLVVRWRATANMPLSDELLAWAYSTSVTFQYNDKRYASAVLGELLHGAQPLSMPSTDLPVHIRECLGYGTYIETSGLDALAALRRSLRGETPVTREAIARLDTIASMTDARTAEAIRHAQGLIAPGRDLMIWMHLEGPLVRSVV